MPWHGFVDQYYIYFMTHKELQEQIDRLSREESMKKQSLESGFSTFKRQMLPGEIAKRILKRGVMKVKSVLPHFSSGSKPRHG